MARAGNLSILTQPVERFAEIILPLPIQSTFTYSIPEEMVPQLKEGSRVCVQFGSRKFYTGIVRSIHTSAPKGYKVKPIIDVLDPIPIVRYPQLKLWEWIADYYLCPLGDVFKCALPAGLKIESETYVAINPDFEEAEDNPLSDAEKEILEVLASKSGKGRLDDLRKSTGKASVQLIVNRLLEREVLIINEKITERYRPKKETMVAFCAEKGDIDTLHAFFDLVTRSRAQEKMLLKWLDLSGWLNPAAQPLPVTKAELMQKAGCSPGVLKALIDKGIFSLYTREINRFSVPVTTTVALPQLSPAQQTALDSITGQWKDKKVCLLHGVTSSGKTEIYTRLISRALDGGDSVLMLVPEISLTTQLTDRLRKFFGERLLVYHSKFTDNERTEIYRRILGSHEPLLILGARSSLFLPFSHLGLIVVDEEHEASFKQQDPAPRYNARDAAIVLASMHGAPVLLGSATPSVETYFKALNGKFGLVTLKERYSGAKLPKVEIIDMREQAKARTIDGLISEPLSAATRRALKAGTQAIFYQNRRGYAPYVECRNCGWSPKCINCDVSLVYHKSSSTLSCHYCGYTIPLPSLCPACGENAIHKGGYGTERIADNLHARFPEARVTRMDLDTTRAKTSYQEIIENFSSRQTDILVGTQMVTKGLDFQGVSLVGILGADSLLNFPDFRAGERAFCSMTQAAGRAGRHENEGEVIIQSFSPGNPILKFVKTQDYEGYYNFEINQRQQFGYPPFTRVINVVIKHRDRAELYKDAGRLAMQLRDIFGGSNVLGPEPPLIGRISSQYILMLMIKMDANASVSKVKNILRKVYADLCAQNMMQGITLYYDVDPV